MVIDNYELLKNKMFKNCVDGETYFVIKVFVRKKDFKADGAIDLFSGLFGSHSERVIYSTSFSNYEEFERYYQLVKILCDNIPYSRAYINTDMKDTKKTVVSLFNKVNEISKRLIMKGETDTGLHREITKISRSVTSLKECDADRKYNWVLLDVDCFGEDNSPDDWDKALKFKERLDEVKIDNIFYKTLNGCHILLSMKDAGKFKNPKEEFKKEYDKFVSSPFVDSKDNAAALLYMNTEIKSYRNELKTKLVLFKAYSAYDIMEAIYFWDGVSNIREKFVHFVSRVTFGEFDESEIMSEEKLKEFLDKICDQEGYDTKPFDSISPDFEFSITLETYKDDLRFIY